MKPHKSTPVIYLLLMLFFLTFAGNINSFAQSGDVDEEYNFLITRADQFYDDQKLDKALYEYQKASNLKPDEAHPKTRIQQISQVLDVQKTKNILFEVAITSAEQLFAAGDYKRAKAEYESALKLNPKAQFPKDRLQEISKMWADPAVEAAYAAAIKKADAHYAKQVYLDAKGEYITASELKPHEQYPLDRILEINELLAAMYMADENYAKHIALADQFLAETKYEDSRENYVEASKAKPEERYPQDQIIMIDELVAQLTAQREEYDALIALADQFYMKREFDKAKIEYKNALQVMPDDSYASSMLEKIDPLIADLNQKKQDYDLAIGNGERLLAAADYEASREQFQTASQLFPEEIYPKNKINEINTLMGDMAAQQVAYDEAITQANQYYSNLDWVMAKQFYQEALDIKPGEQLPSSRLQSINEQLAQLQAQEENYNAAIAKGEAFLEEEKYEDAKAMFQEAMTHKPNETYPPEKISEINQILAQMQDVQYRYDKSIADADKLFNDSKFTQATLAYTTAKNIKPEETYPGERIAEIENILAERTTQQSYDAAIAAADKAFDKRNWPEALAQYATASSINPEEQYPLDQTTVIEKMLADVEALNTAYANAIATGDENYNAEKYTDALANFQEAQNLKPFEKYPTDKIEEINQLLDDMANAQQAYDNAIAAADGFYNNQAWNDALSQYQRALNLKPEEEYPNTKVEEITKLIADLQAQQKAFDDAIAAGDRYFKSEDWQNAKSQYETALEAKPDESYPTEKLAEISGILAQLLSQAEQYDGTVAEADKLFTEKAYEPALAAYNKAAGIKPEEQYPKTRIAEINSILEELDEQLRDYNKAIVEADKEFDKKDYNEARIGYTAALEIKSDETYPTQRIAEIDQILANMAATQKAYDDAIASGDALMNDENYPDAKVQYELATSTKPEESYPKDQIVAINALLLDIKAIEENYASAISNGEEYFNEKDYARSLNSFENAGRIKPDENYPKEKIEEINVILAGIAALEGYEESIAAADRYLREEDYERALRDYTAASEFKPEEQYPRDKIAEIESIFADNQAREENYLAAIALADKLYADKDYQGAMGEYKKAGEFKPGDSYPKTQISKIDGILAGILATDQEYNEAISLADNYLAEAKYEEALRSYQSAAKIKPGESHPTQKIEEINTILADLSETLAAYNDAIKDADKKLKDRSYEEALTAYQGAKDIKPDETYPDEKIAEVTSILANLETEENYNNAIDSADEFLAAKEYQKALDAYKLALQVKPGESYPSDQISSVEGTMAELAAKQKAYDDAIAMGDSQFNSKDYEAALLSYQEALKVYPDESHPKARISELDGILANLRIQQEYDNMIAEADQYFDSEDYDNARNAYQNALNIKPGEAYAQNRITDINDIMLANAEARKEAYDKAIASGDHYYDIEDYKNAKVQYQNAVGMMPDDTYAKGRLKEVEDILMARELALRESYQKAVAKADDLYNKRILDEAIEAYRSAQAVKPDEAYPTNMINEIRQYIQDHTILDITTTKVLITNNTDKKYDYAPIDYGKRKNNYILLKARVVGDDVPKLYLTYGRDGQKSGGIVLTKLREGDTNDYIIRVSAQDPWFRVDNNWMKLYSEGGDIEITSVQVSQGD